MDTRQTGWANIGTGARLFRIAHAAWGALNLGGLGYLTWSAARRRRDKVAFISAGLLCTEGVALLIGRGDCPFGDFQASLGDPVPMFEWVLPPRAAKAAVPTLAIVTIGVLAAFAARSLSSDQHGA